MLSAPLEPPRAGDAPPDARTNLLLQLAVCVFVFLVFGLSISYLPQHPDVPDTWDAFDNPWFDGYPRWDGGWYREIAAEGYDVQFGGTDMSPIPFFPLYPLLMRAMAYVDWTAPPAKAGHYVDERAAMRAGIAINLIAGLLTVLMLLRWTAAWMGPEVAKVTAITLTCYPLTYYLCGPVYSESLFALLAILAFYHLERDRIWLAALFGALATGTRPVGVGLLLGLIVGVFERSKVIQRREGVGFVGSLIPRIQLSNWNWWDARILLAAGGGFAYWCFLFQFADPAHGVPGHKVYTAACAAPGWGMDPGPKVWFKVEAWKQLSSWPYSGKQLLILFHMTLTAIGFACVPLIVRRFGWGLATYVAFALFIPALSSKDFIAMGRYILPCFPIFALVGEFLTRRPPWQRVVVWAGGLVAMGFLASRFCRWWYVS